MDLSGNKTLKAFMKKEFSEWCSSVVYQNFTTRKPTASGLAHVYHETASS